MIFKSWIVISTNMHNMIMTLYYEGFHYHSSGSYISDALIRQFTDIPINWYLLYICTNNRYRSSIISIFWFLMLSLKMNISSIIMSIIKAIINDAIITRNDIIDKVFTISVTTFRNNRYQCLPIMTNIDYRSDY